MSTVESTAPAAVAGPERVRAVDWLRGLAVLFMVQCHSLDLLLPELRRSEAARRLLQVDGLVAPAFLFAAGFALALLQVRSAAAGGQRERLGRAVQRVGVVLGAAAFMNFLWFHPKLLREPWWLVRLDILLCAGVALVAVLPVSAGLAARPRVLRGVALGLALTVFGLSPFGEGTQGAWAWVLRKSADTPFPVVPWLGYGWLGAYAGAVAGEEGRRGLVRALWLLMGLGLAGWFAAEPLRELYPEHRFYVTNPSNAATRWLWVCALLRVLLAVEERLGARAPASPVRRFVERFSACSLSAYVFHQVLLYYPLLGFSFQAAWGGRSGWGQYVLLTGLLVALTYGLCLAWEALLRTSRQGLATLAPAYFAKS